MSAVSVTRAAFFNRFYESVCRAYIRGERHLIRGQSDEQRAQQRGARPAT